ncbi:hypothetical protein L345_17195, partial [Ophiophagus hannah]
MFSDLEEHNLTVCQQLSEQKGPAGTKISPSHFHTPLLSCNIVLFHSSFLPWVRKKDKKRVSFGLFLLPSNKEARRDCLKWWACRILEIVLEVAGPGGEKKTGLKPMGQPGKYVEERRGEGRKEEKKKEEMGEEEEEKDKEGRKRRKREEEKEKGKEKGKGKEEKGKKKDGRRRRRRKMGGGGDRWKEEEKEKD